MLATNLKFLADEILTDLWHAVELRHNALFTLGDRDGIMKDSGVCVVTVGLLAWPALVEGQYLIDDDALLARWLSRG